VDQLEKSAHKRAQEWPVQAPESLQDEEEVSTPHTTHTPVSFLNSVNWIGGIVFGPRRRSFATKIQRRVYDLAFRTAVSLRFAKGELILSHPLFLELPKTKMLLSLLRQLRWTKKAGGGTLFVTGKERKNLVMAAGKLGEHVMVKRVRDLKVRDLLLMGRIVFERRAFERLIEQRGVDRPRVIRKDPIRDYERLMKLL